MVTIRVENFIDFAASPKAKMRADRIKSGVLLPDDTWAAIVTARGVGVSEVSVQRAMS
jgi:hypothetical protein